MVLLAFVALIAWIADYGSKRRLNSQIDAIRKKGEPFSVQDLITSERWPNTDENPTIHFIAAGKSIGAIEIPIERLKQIPSFGQTPYIPTGQRLPEEQVEGAKWFLEQNRDALEAIHNACARSSGWFDYQWSRPMLGNLHPDLVDIRTASRILGLDARLSAEQEDAARAARRLIDCYRCAKFTDGNRYRVIIGNLSRIGHADFAMDTTERIINRIQLADDDLTRLLVEVAPWCQPDGLADSIVAERVAFCDLAGSYRSAPFKDRSLMMIPVIRFADESAGVAKLTDLADALRTPEPGTWNAVLAWRQRPPVPSYYYMTNLLLKGFDRYIDLSFRVIGEARAMRAAIACERFRLRHERWPSELSEVCPELLDRLPVDPFDGKPIRYSIVAEGIQLWTIAEDGIDNGGDIRQLQLGDKYRRKDAGWIILNPDQRGRN